MAVNARNIKGFQLIHTVKGKSTTTRFSKEEFPLFKEWVEICRNNGFEFQAYVIEKDDTLKAIGQ